MAVATILDVAKRAGVSTATVSRVMRGPKDLVTPKVHGRVLVAVRELAYVPNVAAQSLRVLRSRKLLVTVPDIANPAFAAVLKGVETAARREQYTVLLGDTERRSTNEEAYGLVTEAARSGWADFCGPSPAEGHEAASEFPGSPLRALGERASNSRRGSVWRASQSTIPKQPTMPWITCVAWVTGGSA